MAKAYLAASKGVRVSELDANDTCKCETDLAKSKNDETELAKYGALYGAIHKGKLQSSEKIEVTASFGREKKKVFLENPTINDEIATWANSSAIENGAWAGFKPITIKDYRVSKGSVNEGTAKKTHQDYAGLRINVSAIYVPVLFVYIIGFCGFSIPMFQSVDISVAGITAVLKSDHVT